ncbi:MAG: neutral zinc metallopeptidase [Saccharopolyspora sp.]|uniref:neutral zinc metallopeptidase n=1 Tax=Saccharopolyspora sp. TaxID=33915 RepID=UPI0025FB14D7|nr:neutral zinc metallopeptidase [Saccharopolyspora sp.]MBQ6640474.1 neutral zinc metallopeptidase [Saccharopolyspora sp.]
MTQPPPQRPGAPSGRRQQPDPRSAGDKRRSGNTGLIVGLVIVGIFLLGFGTVGVGAIALNTGTTGGDRPVTHDPTDLPAPASGTEPSDEETTSRRPVRPRQPDHAYASAPRPVSALAENPINIAGNGAVDAPCPLPPFATDTAAQDAFYQAAAPCLMQAWAPALRAANLPARTPSVVTTATDLNTPCGHRTWDQTAMYCPSDNTIYMTSRYYAEKENRVEGGAYLGQFAHEFGHAIQAMSGINPAYLDASKAAGGSSPAGLELTRRSELQATCFEGMTLAALQNGGVRNDLVLPALADSRARGDEYNEQPDHGRIATNTKWIDRGFSGNEVTACNTWAAAPSDVD